MSSENKPTIFLTGANGYIAKHIVKQALDAGYNVVGTVRSVEKGEALTKLVKTDKFSYEVVAGVDHKGAFDLPLKKHPEVTVLIHAASPLNFDVKDPLNDTILPVIRGVKELFDSVKINAPQITRLVLTTSVAAIAVLKGINAVGGPYTESDWSPITIEEGSEDGYKAYCASKKFEELAAWKYVEEEKPNFTLATVAPAYAIGPQAFEEDAAAGIQASTSSSIAGLLKLGKSDEIPVFVGDMVDVRDVAKCHILAFELDSAQGERFIAASECFSNHQAIEVITKVFPQYKDLLPTPDLDEREKPTAPIFQNERTRKILGFEFIKPEVSIVDQLNQLFKYK